MIFDLYSASTWYVFGILLAIPGGVILTVQTFRWFVRRKEHAWNKLTLEETIIELNRYVRKHGGISKRMIWFDENQNPVAWGDDIGAGWEFPNITVTTIPTVAYGGDVWYGRYALRLFECGKQGA